MYWMSALQQEVKSFSATSEMVQRLNLFMARWKKKADGVYISYIVRWYDFFFTVDEVFRLSSISVWKKSREFFSSWKTLADWLTDSADSSITSPMMVSWASCRGGENAGVYSRVSRVMLYSAYSVRFFLIGQIGFCTTFRKFERQCFCDISHCSLNYSMKILILFLETFPRRLIGTVSSRQKDIIG